MATQLQHTDFAIPPLSPRPNIRVAFSAGAATIAMREGMADMPAQVRDATLDELALQSMVADLLKTAADHLSPSMYAAFLKWGEAAVRFNTKIDTDAALDAQSIQHYDALYELNQTSTQTISDMCLKAYIAAVEAHDRGGVFGPIDIANRENWPFGGAMLAVGFVDDILTMSPVTKLLNEVADRAWELSGYDLAWTPEIGLPLADQFANAPARAVPLCASVAAAQEQRLASRTPVDFTGEISPAFQALLDTAAATKAAHSAYYRQEHNPAETRYYTLDRSTPEKDATARVTSGIAIAEERSNELLDLDTIAENAVAAYPVSTAADFMAKLDFMADRDMCQGQNWSAELRADSRRVAQAVADERDKPSDVLGGWPDSLRRSSLYASFAERNRLLANLDGGGEELSAADHADLSRVNRLDGVVLDSPARDAGDVVLKLLMIAHVSAEGADAGTERATAVIQEAQRFLVTGYVFSPAPQKDAVMPTASVPRAAWDAAWATHEAALAADRLLDAEHSAAQAAGVVPDQLEADWNDSGMGLGDLEWDLLNAQAPDLSALEWKLTILSKRGLVFEGDIAERIISDVAAIRVADQSEQGR